jgi:hypothetical protein
MKRFILAAFAAVVAIGLIAMSPAPAEARFGDGKCVAKHVSGHSYFWAGVTRHGKTKWPVVNWFTGMVSTGGGFVSGTTFGVAHGAFGCK